MGTDSAPRTDRTQRLHLGLMLALTFSTGVVDAVGYIDLDGVFTGNMTGNVLIGLGALAGALTQFLGVWAGITLSATTTLVVALWGHLHHRAAPEGTDQS